MGIRNLAIVFISISLPLPFSFPIHQAQFFPPSYLSCTHWRVLHHNRVQFFDSDFGGVLISLPEDFRHALGHQTLRLFLDGDGDGTVVGGLLGLLGVFSLEDVTGAL